MESRDSEIYREIGQLLYDAAPKDARNIIMRAKLSSEGDHAQLEFDYTNPAGATSWFTGGGALNTKLLDLLVALRDFFVSQNQPRWTQCEFTLDTQTGKFGMNFKYD
jgi:hypothetical protein